MMSPFLHVSSPLLRIACVGDSITAGYLASNASMTYPGRLQAFLDASHPGVYEVTNLGAGGATLQKRTSNPYWERDQFRTFAAGSWDVVVIMLGTNDANEQPDDWPAACSTPDATVDTCSFLSDYSDLIQTARSHTTGKTPLVAVVIPPPLMREGAYQLNQTIINDLLPNLSRQVAADASLPAPIDVYSSLGGTANWRFIYPDCGCAQQATLLAIPSRTRNGAGANYTLLHGYPPQGSDVAGYPQNLTYHEAVSACDAAGNGCAAITFEASVPKPDEPTKMFLKRCHDSPIGGGDWFTWQKPLEPPSHMPQSCALYCDQQSCDQCHPNDAGYAQIATMIGEYIRAHKPPPAVSSPTLSAPAALPTGSIGSLGRG